jgi:predicted DsbA family dithiol-disulfide isomerase
MSYTQQEKLAWEFHGLKNAINTQRALAEIRASEGKGKINMQRSLAALFELAMAEDELKNWKKKHGINTRR